MYPTRGMQTNAMLGSILGFSQSALSQRKPSRSETEDQEDESRK